MIIVLILTALALAAALAAFRRREPGRREVLRGLAAPFATVPPPPEPDPFEALRLQLRLHALADEINRLHWDESIFARAARLEASAAAYDALLGRACRLAGVPETGESTCPTGFATPPPQRLAGRDLRARRELLLAERGWSW
ncbi:hypothetical protein LWF15_09390 [Kineosporia rhizophila]|uniref:hypothetical protein n=1 Tax=Kineosporia TaxID=49184 RepID=UPI001E4145F2|nr:MULTISPECIES: hypothetical protein [Kineosporia]MCE0535726.1 hypothetical protein [Kineosporia rhizophila]GLY17624.1 hypothetical protein Kisp01_46380 [Kineosporia sp. NBRC 101677]